MDKRAIAVLSTSNLIHNVGVIKNKVGSTKIIAMVKANAYGHGIRSVSLRIAPIVDALGVASIEEAMILRGTLKELKSTIILMQGILEQNDLIVAAENDLELVIHNHIQLQWLLNTILPKPLKIWIKVNTGMGRLGFMVNDIYEVYETIAKSGKTQGHIKIMSHFACAEDIKHPLNIQQINLFSQITNDIDTEFSLCNSAGIFNFPDNLFDYVRPGLALYGASSIKGLSASRCNLKPVMTLTSILTAIQTFKKGDSIGYGAEYICPENMLVGIASFGYGDGYPINSKKAQVLLNDTLCNVIGRVSMDMLAIDLRQTLTAKVGDRITLWGEGLPVEKLAEQTQNIPYNLLTGVQNRVKFIWN